EGIGSHVAVALQNARLYEASERRAQETAIINELAREISGELDQERVFDSVSRYLPRLMPANAFVVWFYDEQTQTTTRPVLFDLGVRYPPETKPNPLNARLTHIVTTNSPVVLNRTRQEWEEEKNQTNLIFGSSDPSASLLYVPLRVGNRIR